MEVLTILLSTAGPVSPAALAARLMLERSTISRNLAPCRKGWVAVVAISATGRAMSVTITDRQIRQRTTRVARAAQKHAAGTPAGRQD
jgi:DNA-binding MarR family transcriptional regulator